MHYTIDILEDYIHGELGTERDATIHAHLETCADCHALYDETVSVREWIRAAAQAEERAFPALIKARVWEAVRNEQPSLADRLRMWWKPMLAVPVAGVLAVVAFIGLPIHGSATPGVAATYLLEEHAALASDNPLADRGLIVPASMVDSTRSTTLMDDGSSSDQ
jgi:anti-sigma factor RsiW